jgi:hypothetical protein
LDTAASSLNKLTQVVVSKYRHLDRLWIQTCQLSVDTDASSLNTDTWVVVGEYRCTDCLNVLVVGVYGCVMEYGCRGCWQMANTMDAQVVGKYGHVDRRQSVSRQQIQMHILLEPLEYVRNVGIMNIST